MRNQTNEKLSRVKLLLYQLENAAGRENLVAALAEATLLQLGLAYRIFLSELATAQGLTMRAPHTAATLAEILAEQQLHIAEVDELVSLEQARQWPHKLRKIAESGVKSTPKQTSAKAQDGLINVLQVDDAAENILSYAHCFEVYQALRSCIQHQRDMAQEW